MNLTDLLFLSIPGALIAMKLALIVIAVSLIARQAFKSGPVLRKASPLSHYGFPPGSRPLA